VAARAVGNCGSDVAGKANVVAAIRSAENVNTRTIIRPGATFILTIFLANSPRRQVEKELARGSNENASIKYMRRKDNFRRNGTRRDTAAIRWPDLQNAGATAREASPRSGISKPDSECGGPEARGNRRQKSKTPGGNSLQASKCNLRKFSHGFAQRQDRECFAAYRKGCRMQQSPCAMKPMAGRRSSTGSCLAVGGHDCVQAVLRDTVRSPARGMAQARVSRISHQPSLCCTSSSTPIWPTLSPSASAWGR
jgi:hypothetical protein